jgi:beta-glucanase (GH16 family)
LIGRPAGATIGLARPGGSNVKTAILYAAVLAVLSFCAPPAAADPPKDGSWKLVFSDDFDGKEVDGTKWEKVGDGKRRDAFWLKENAVLDGKGNLVVKSTFDGTRYGCGGLRTRGKYAHSFGYYEIRCKVPQQPGTWSAFWLYDAVEGKIGNGGSDGAEIDIYESPWLGKSKYNIAVHWDGYGKEHRSWGRKIDAPKLDDGFHVFGLLWTKDEYVFYYDGKEVARTSEGGVCQVPLYLKVTTEIGEWAGDIKKAKLPDEFVVDWVKVHDRVDAPAGEKKKAPAAAPEGKEGKAGAPGAEGKKEG